MTAGTGTRPDAPTGTRPGSRGGARTGAAAVSPRRAVRLHSRAHIDLLRVAASLCRS
ncbi:MULTISPECIES: hypothetical protein [unclassified Streptomyces]|uniref:hypothetical protein n=1 Tax=unclassified Streptomyces TaxID=2593676 RepID=UPI0013A6A57E|nr:MULTISPECIES: hypothetical protein [unclassified Streptomyces]